MTKEKLIERKYRISKKDDELVKKNANRWGGEAAYVRQLIRQGIISK